jgi:hypothetical protein
MGNAKSARRRKRTIRTQIGRDHTTAQIGPLQTTLMTNCITIDDFDLLTVIGRGSYGKVY